MFDGYFVSYMFIITNISVSYLKLYCYKAHEKPIGYVSIICIK